MRNFPRRGGDYWARTYSVRYGLTRRSTVLPRACLVLTGFRAPSLCHRQRSLLPFSRVLTRSRSSAQIRILSTKQKNTYQVFFVWWRLLGSNQRPFACEANALPAELSLRSFGIVAQQFLNDNSFYFKNFVY